MRTTPQSNYSADIVREQAPDLFLLSLFVRAPQRPALLSLYAIEVELAHVRRAVSEEALGHIRYAWWEESLQMIATRKASREHPVLQSLTPELIPYALRLADSYRSHYPNLPSEHDALLETVSLEWIRANSPQSEVGWRKAKAVIDAHRNYYGHKKRMLLQLKLIRIGLL